MALLLAVATAGWLTLAGSALAEDSRGDTRWPSPILDSGDITGGLRDPLEALYAAITPGISSAELAALFEAHAVAKRFEPLYSGNFISLFWKGDDILRENQIPSSGLVIRIRNQQVICVFYGFHYDRHEFIERRRKGSCPDDMAI